MYDLKEAEYKLQHYQQLLDIEKRCNGRFIDLYKTRIEILKNDIKEHKKAIKNENKIQTNDQP
jgi:hypothetical protein